MRSRNFHASFASAAAPGATDTEFAVAHGLGADSGPVTPRGWTVTRRNKAAQLYESGTAWTSTTAYFKADTALARFNVMFFI